MNEVVEVKATPITIAELNRDEIDIQISTAKKFPRSVEKFRQDALSMATLDKDIAASCFYKLKRKGKDGESVFIEGPSVRLAEIIASAWHNLRFGARIISEDNRFVVAQGVAYDLENNVCNTIEVSRRITGKDGRRYTDDMIGVTKNAACSIALRNAIFKTIPFTYAKQIYEKAKETATGDAKTVAERRQSMIAAFGKISVTQDQILAYCEKQGVGDIGLAEIEDLIGVYTAIKDGDTTIDEQFGGKAKEIHAPVAIVPDSELSLPVRFQKAKAILFGKKGQKAVDAACSKLTKDVADLNEKELSELIGQLEAAAK